MARPNLVEIGGRTHASGFALPPGHPDTWGLLTAGTMLEGSPYPYPVPGVPHVGSAVVHTEHAAPPGGTPAP